MVILPLFPNFVGDHQGVSYLIHDLAVVPISLRFLIIAYNVLTIAADPVLVSIILNLPESLIVRVKVDILDQVVGVYNLTAATAHFSGLSFIDVNLLGALAPFAIMLFEHI